MAVLEKITDDHYQYMYVVWILCWHC